MTRSKLAADSNVATPAAWTNERRETASLPEGDVGGSMLETRADKEIADAVQAFGISSI
jgi:hypothetical protein